MKNDLDYAPADSTDAAMIYAMCKALIDCYEDPASIDYEKVLAWTKRKIETQIGQYTCILKDGQKAGYYRLYPMEGQLELDDFYVLPDFRNQGIGTKSLKRIISEADCPIFLYVFTQNRGAVKLYRRMGFEKVEQVSATRCILRRKA